METIERTLPRDRELPPGPWDAEPDKIQWPDEATGLPCLLRRAPAGHLCGYVGVDESHPWHGKDYMDSVVDADVHGGLTYAALCDGDEEAGICHVPGPGEPDPLWWFGFDCAHYLDVRPVDFGRYDFEKDHIYRDVAYVKAEVARLAEQIAGAAA